MNFVDEKKIEKYMFHWNNKEQTGGEKETEDIEIQPFLGGGGFPLNEFNILKQNAEKHISRFKDLVVPMGLVLENHIDELKNN